MLASEHAHIRALYTMLNMIPYLRDPSKCHLSLVYQVSFHCDVGFIIFISTLDQVVFGYGFHVPQLSFRKFQWQFYFYVDRIFVRDVYGSGSALWFKTQISPQDELR